MPTVVFSNGREVQFDKEPTPQDIEEVAKQLGINTAKQEPPKPKEKSFLRKVGDFFTSSEQGLGSTIGGALGVQTKEYKASQERAAQAAQLQSQLENKILEKKKAGQDILRLEKQRKSNLATTGMQARDIVPELNKTNKQIAGEALGTILDVASAGTYGMATKGAKAGTLLKSSQITSNLAKKPLTSLVKNTAIQGAKTGAGYGAGYAASTGMQENKSTGDIILDTIKGGLTGAVFGGATGALAGKSELKSRLGYEQKAKEVTAKAIEQYRSGIKVGKQKYAEMQDKIIPELLKEKTWGTFSSLMKKADDGVALSGEEYKKLGELKGITDISTLIDDIDKRMADLVTEGGRVVQVNKPKYKMLSELKKDILSLKQGTYIATDKGISTQTAKSQKLRELAHTYGESLYETRSAQKTVEDNKTLSQLKRVDGMIRGLLNKENPDYADINKLYSASTNLKDVLLESSKMQGKGFPGIKEIIEKAGGLLGGAMIGGYAGGVENAILSAAAVGSIASIKNSTWYNTLRAVQKQQLAEKILAKEGIQFSQTLNLLAKQGLKYAEQLINE